MNGSCQNSRMAKPHGPYPTLVSSVRERRATPSRRRAPAPRHAARPGGGAAGCGPGVRRRCTSAGPTCRTAAAFMERIERHARPRPADQPRSDGPGVRGARGRTSRARGTASPPATPPWPSSSPVSALGMKGDVIVPSYTFVATVHALWRQGITPVFCDIDPTTHCLDLDSVEASITPADHRHPRRAHVGQHLCHERPGGDRRAPRPEAAVRRRARLRLRDEAARWAAIGDAEVFSFHATKFVQHLRRRRNRHRRR